MTINTYADFPSRFKGHTWRPGDDTYAAARNAWNNRYAERQPALIARCVDVEDVVTAVRYAAKKRTPIAIRGGAHGIDGSSMPHAALVIDLSLLKGLSVNPQTGHARIAPGVVLGEMDVGLQRYGLAVPSGQVSTTGVTGLALGGGVGYLTRRFGLTVDNIRACELVTADGRQIRASADENQELFWGLRGAGHNFGVVTALEVQAHPLAANLVCGFMVFPLAQAAAVLEQLDEYMTTAPRELCVIPLLLRMPAIPGLCADAVGKPALLFNIVYTGLLEHSAGVIGTLAKMGSPILNLIGPSTWVEANCRADALSPWGRRAFSYSGHLPAMTRPMIEAMVEMIAQQPTPSKPGIVGAIALPGMDGAVHDVPEDSTAYSRAGAKWMWEAMGVWDEPGRDDEFVSWVASVRQALRPHMLKSGYVNLTVHQGAEWLQDVYGGPVRYRRLTEIKAKWDPNNLFRFNKNIEPAK
jgi:FAD binding domain/Berberine and berberine like